MASDERERCRRRPKDGGSSQRVEVHIRDRLGGDGGCSNVEVARQLLQALRHGRIARFLGPAFWPVLGSAVRGPWLRRKFRRLFVAPRRHPRCDKDPKAPQRFSHYKSTRSLIAVAPRIDPQASAAHSRHFPGQKLRLGGDALGADPTYLLYLPSRPR